MDVPSPANDTLLRHRLAALEADLCSLRVISGVLLRGLAVAPSQTLRVLDAALDDALQTLATEQGRVGASAPLITRVRGRLWAEAGLPDRPAHGGEHLTHDGVVIRGDFGRRPRARSSDGR